MSADDTGKPEVLLDFTFASFFNFVYDFSIIFLFPKNHPEFFIRVYPCQSNSKYLKFSGDFRSSGPYIRTGRSEITGNF